MRIFKSPLRINKAIIFVMPALFLIQTWNLAQRTGYTKEEFMNRRARIMQEAGEGMVVLFGECLPQPGAHFRQDNDFYYFCGREDLNTILLMAPQTGESFLFIPRQTPREEMIEGPNLLKDESALEKTGLTAVYPVSYFDEFIARKANTYGKVFYLRLSPRDTVDDARWETMIFEGRKNRSHYNDQLTLDAYRTKKLKERYPAFQFKDIVPMIDAMRLIKTDEERAVIRRNGKISAEAVKQAMLATRVGGFEYEVEAAAVHTILHHGCKGVAYPAIVGSGPNSCIWHYSDNGRRIEEGDLVLMDFGGDLDYLCMDITRTWPASGKFTPEQREIYAVVLAVQKACIEAYRPGATREDVERHVAEVLAKKGLDSHGLKGGFGHTVGMAVHDVGIWPEGLKEGMVFAIEPGLYYPEKNIGIRIEDTVLITKVGCEVLSRGVPKEIDEIEALLAKRK
ncbi:MAG: aminopeptidase P family protein [Candidatus Aminicenantes bacterium]|nr:aminopeptidase P family protein [Candidatus Aminicenantes bacterium]